MPANEPVARLVEWCNTQVNTFNTLAANDAETVATEAKTFGDIRVTVARTWFSFVMTVQATGDSLLRQGFVSSMIVGANSVVVTPSCVVYCLTRA